MKNTLKNFKNILLVIFIGIVLFELFMQLKFIVDDTKNYFISISIIILVSILYYMFYKWIKSKNIIESKLFSSKKIGFSFSVVIIIFSLLTKIALSRNFSNKTENQSRIEDLEKNMDIWTNIIRGSVSPAIIEEICYRGILYLIIFTSASILINLNRNYKYIAIACFLIFSSLFFGFSHVAVSYDFQNIGSYIVSGIILSVIYILTRNIFIPIIVHALDNFFGVLNRSGYEQSLEIIAIILPILLIIFLAYCLKKYRHEIGGYGSYINYKIKKARAKKILKKDADKRSVLH